MEYVRIARNEAFAEPSEALAEGDVLALIPPVAGG
jgi:molybdopterin converting factor small subunit